MTGSGGKGPTLRSWQEPPTVDGREGNELFHTRKDYERKSEISILVEFRKQMTINFVLWLDHSTGCAQLHDN